MAKMLGKSGKRSHCTCCPLIEQCGQMGKKIRKAREKREWIKDQNN